MTDLSCLAPLSDALSLAFCCCVVFELAGLQCAESLILRWQRLLLALLDIHD
jgi:hypothetical protein